MKRLLTIGIISLCLLFSCGEKPETPGTPGTYKITYHGNGSTSGYPPVDNNEYTSGENAIVLGQNTLLKTEYTFGGWNTKANNSGTRYVSGDTIEIKNMNILLHAVWIPE